MGAWIKMDRIGTARPASARRLPLVAGTITLIAALAGCAGAGTTVENARRVGWATSQDVTMFLSGSPPVVVAAGTPDQARPLADAVGRAVGHPLPVATTPPDGPHILLRADTQPIVLNACDPVAVGRPAGTQRLQLALCADTGDPLGAATVRATDPAALDQALGQAVILLKQPGDSGTRRGGN